MHDDSPEMPVTDSSFATARRLRQALGMLKTMPGLTESQRLIIDTALSGEAPGRHASPQAAAAFEARARAAGIDCYTRMWHLGDVGFFTVGTADYRRVLESEVITQERHHG